MSRTELAAQLYGSAHGLDQGTRRTTLATYALRYVVGDLDARDRWEAAHIVADRVSAPALTWRLPVVGDSPLDHQVRVANAGNLPVHLTSYALRRHAPRVAAGTHVYVVENPRIVEAAAERCSTACLVAANGNPSSAVMALLAQLRDNGAILHYHGDFDAAGIAICARMHAAGIVPWRMDGADYNAALALADERGVPLERDPRACGDTPWDGALATSFNRERRIVHEELLVEVLLAAMCAAV
jgi:uncharacterized protein (TIGR02679 family)